MLECVTTPRNRTLTLLFLVACAVASMGAATAGVSDNPPGIVLAYIAAISLVLAWVHPWRTLRQFTSLTIGSLAGFALAIALAAILESAATHWFIASNYHDLILQLSDGALLFAILVFPASFLVGTVGGITLELRERGRSRRARSLAA